MNCKEREHNNCGNHYDLIDTAFEHTKANPELPQWMKDDLKIKWTGKYKSKYPRTVLMLGEIRLYECPLTWITPETALIKNVLFLGEKPEKILPGTWLDQPNWYIESVNVYRQVRNYLADPANKKGNNG